MSKINSNQNVTHANEHFEIEFDPSAKAGLRMMYDEERAVIDEFLVKLRHSPEKIGKAFKHEEWGVFYGADAGPFKIIYQIDTQKHVVYVVSISAFVVNMAPEGENA